MNGCGKYCRIFSTGLQIKDKLSLSQRNFSE